MGKKLKKTREQLDAASRTAAEQTARAEAAERRAAEAERTLADRTPPGSSDELAAVFREAEEAVAKIVDEGSRRALADTSMVEEELAATMTELARLRAWQERLGSDIGRVRDAGAGARATLEQCRAQLFEALAAFDAALESIDATLGADGGGAGDGVIDLTDRTPTGSAPPG